MNEIGSVKSIILHAPNVHTGGGLRLLALLLTDPRLAAARLNLDARCNEQLAVPTGAQVEPVRRSVWSRLKAEFRLRREAGPETVTLCFHGLPPLFRLPGKVVVFVQNRLLIDNTPVRGVPLRVRVRLWLERRWVRYLQGHANRFIVQTPSMHSLIIQMLRPSTPVDILPFSELPKARDGLGNEFDFVYVASGDEHKNHRTLIEAWQILAGQGVYPSLALTVDSHCNSELVNWMTRSAAEYGLRIHNLGVLPQQEVDALYSRARALIYPSLVESFGLPLIEAAAHGLSIVAAELDYVRDVAEPAESFDPRSPVSIARAVCRFIGVPCSPIHIKSTAEFLSGVLR